MTAAARQKRHQDRLRAAGGTVIRLRLHPETVAALAQLCAATGHSREYVVNECVVAAACSLTAQEKETPR